MRFQSMSDAIAEYGALFLDFDFKPSGDYDKSDLIKTAAYTVLAHSELEAYFEGHTIDIIHSAETLWRGEGKPCRSLISLCSFGFGGEKDRPPQQKPTRDIWQEQIFKSTARAKEKISANNGIRSQNIIPLLTIIGFDVRDIEDDLLSELDALATMRGAHAHNPISGQVFDPFDRKKKIEKVISLIADFDQKIEAFKLSQFDPSYVAPVSRNRFFDAIRSLFPNNLA